MIQIILIIFAILTYINPKLMVKKEVLAKANEEQKQKILKNIRSSYIYLEIGVILLLSLTTFENPLVNIGLLIAIFICLYFNFTKGKKAANENKEIYKKLGF